MSNNLDELKGLVATIATDRQAQKDKEKREAWTKYVALSMIVLAVLAATATQRGAGYSSTTMKQLNVATFEQAQASDQWSFYQAKGIKLSIAAEERDVLSATANPDPKRIADLDKKTERYANEQKEITVEAKKLEAKRDEATASATASAKRGSEMGLATTLFQIAISLGGVTLIVKKRWLWSASLLTGAIASAQMARVLWFM
jgi:hypothetical protein